MSGTLESNNSAFFYAKIISSENNIDNTPNNLKDHHKHVAVILPCKRYLEIINSNCGNRFVYHCLCSDSYDPKRPLNFDALQFTNFAIQYCKKYKAQIRGVFALYCFGTVIASIIREELDYLPGPRFHHALFCGNKFLSRKYLGGGGGVYESVTWSKVKEVKGVVGEKRFNRPKYFKMTDSHSSLHVFKVLCWGDVFSAFSSMIQDFGGETTYLYWLDLRNKFYIFHAQKYKAVLGPAEDSSIYDIIDYDSPSDFPIFVLEDVPQVNTSNPTISFSKMQLSVL